MKTPNRDDAGMANAMRIADNMVVAWSMICGRESSEDITAALLLLVAREAMVFRMRPENRAAKVFTDLDETERLSAVGETVFDALAETLDNVMQQIDRDTAGGQRAETEIQPDNSGTPGGA